MKFRLSSPMLHWNPSCWGWQWFLSCQIPGGFLNHQQPWAQLFMSSFWKHIFYLAWVTLLLPYFLCSCLGKAMTVSSHSSWLAPSLLDLKNLRSAPGLSPLVVSSIFLCSLLSDLSHYHGFKYLYLGGSEFIFSAFYFSLGSRCVCLTLFSTSPLGCLQSNFKFNSFKIEFLIFFSPTVLTLIFINGTAIHSARAKLLQLCVTHCDSMDCSPLGSSVYGILQARILEWVCHALLQGIFLTQGRNPRLLFLLHCSDQILGVILDVYLAHRPHINQKISLYQKIIFNLKIELEYNQFIMFTITFLVQDCHSDSQLVSLLLILPTAKSTAPGNLIKNVNQVMEVTFLLKIL